MRFPEIDPTHDPKCGLPFLFSWRNYSVFGWISRKRSLTWPQNSKKRRLDKLSRNVSSSWHNFEQNWIETHKNCMDEFSINRSSNLPARVKSYSRASKDDVSEGLSFKNGYVSYNMNHERNFDEAMLFYLWSIFKFGF